MIEHRAVERLGLLDVDEVRGAGDHGQARAGIPSAIASACSGGVAGSSAPTTTSVGAEMPISSERKSQTASALQQAT